MIQFQKNSQSLPTEVGKESQIIFRRGVYLTENTSQAASVRVVRLRQTTRARSRLRKFVEKARKGFFDSLKNASGKMPEAFFCIHGEAVP